jgi:putative Holliday junction resolvase
VADAAVDYGRIRTGFAAFISGVVLPLEPLTDTSWSAIRERLAGIFNDHGPGRVVLGLPLNASGGDTELSLEVRKLAAWLKGRGYDVHTVNEVRSTVEALQSRPSAKRDGTTDSIAATVLLRRFLNLP